MKLLKLKPPFLFNEVVVETAFDPNENVPESFFLTTGSSTTDVIPKLLDSLVLCSCTTSSDSAERSPNAGNVFSIDLSGITSNSFSFKTSITGALNKNEVVTSLDVGALNENVDFAGIGELFKNGTVIGFSAETSIECTILLLTVPKEFLFAL